eukprot:TRINITY_DN33401_c0_g1_i1.p2 TRINITY_DN33401_c0_g1~~TRINITY_DN33401_c0_g1_i1.p2  ORF type:complete len:196 (+),score=60.94 TRINITY_DN33401_c0_g1_i1:233-820(+)
MAVSSSRWSTSQVRSSTSGSLPLGRSSTGGVGESSQRGTGGVVLEQEKLAKVRDKRVKEALEYLGVARVLVMHEQQTQHQQQVLHKLLHSHPPASPTFEPRTSGGGKYVTPAAPPVPATTANLRSSSFDGVGPSDSRRGISPSVSPQPVSIQVVTGRSQLLDRPPDTSRPAPTSNRGASKRANSSPGRFKRASHS